MVAKTEIYRCEVCGNIVEVLYAGDGTLVCCGQPMKKQDEKTQAMEGKEKHVPVIERTQNGIKVKVGSIPHPMEEKHSIQWIQVLAGAKSYRAFLKPGDKPEAEFAINDASVVAREYCNLHGLWKSG